MGHESGRPRHQDGHHTQCQPLVPLRSPKRHELHTPVQSTQEGQDDGSVGDLDGLQVVQERGGCLEVDPGEGVIT